MNKILIITGLTSTGKSSLAVKIAKKYNGEIISADSVQIYKGLDIGSAKVDKSTQKQVKHYLIDIKNPNENYNVGEFIADCKRAIDDIISKGKLPIIVGGTGLYIKALIEGYSLGETKSNIDFRNFLQEKAQKFGNKCVWDILNKKNPEKAATVHFNNLKRVIRYLEIEEFGNFSTKTKSILDNYNVLSVGIVEDREVIYNKINARVDEMIKSGLQNEIKHLIDSGISSSCQSMQAIGYKEWFDYFNGSADLTTTINLIKQHTRNYCKRQLTFLKTIKNIKLCSIDQAETIIKEFLW